MRASLSLSAATALLLLSAGTVARAQLQGEGERAAQARLPQGGTPLWTTLRQTRIGEDQARGLFTAAHPPQVRALSGRTISPAGFVMPLDAQTRGNHFLLSRYTPVCAFCPPGEPNEVVEVHTAQPIAFPTRLVTVTGTFGLENKGENGLFFRMTGAFAGLAPFKWRGICSA